MLQLLSLNQNHKQTIHGLILSFKPLNHHNIAWNEKTYVSMTLLSFVDSTLLRSHLTQKATIYFCPDISIATIDCCSVIVDWTSG